jgi:hypothetical protein
LREADAFAGGDAAACVRRGLEQPHLQDGVGHGTSYVIEVVMNAFGREGSDCSFHVVSFVVDGKIETEL